MNSSTLLDFQHWETRLLRFIELPGVGRMVDSEEERRAAHPDEWIVWEAEERVAA
jgi:hypothetical protein